MKSSHSWLDFILNLSLISICVGHSIYSPYSKVEESFNLQAIHDHLAFGFHKRDLQKVSDMLLFPSFFIVFTLLILYLFIYETVRSHPIPWCSASIFHCLDRSFHHQLSLFTPSENSRLDSGFFSDPDHQSVHIFLGTLH